MRLKPAAPLLAPHQSSDDCIIGGYDIPRDTMVLVNAWAIHRDPKMWEDPTSFRPERFEGLDANAYKLIPFGPSEELVDMSEGTGLTMPKAQPLEALCKTRESMINVFKEL
ncbi:hypothetical protein P3X46_021068 [Hevea brasiliensis]|uniref:Cytochrome P450 n=1 Tax=Hevea brasiliensis TaxID=3981 RepID=A0ABQ9LFI8_HEVBR|nr:hypothetical protein P3X46_021068 [Hevea brasiliensis]